jgi:hypothetical protein
MESERSTQTIWMSEGMQKWWSKRLLEAVSPSKFVEALSGPPVKFTCWQRIELRGRRYLRRCKDAWDVLRGNKQVDDY